MTGVFTERAAPPRLHTVQGRGRLLWSLAGVLLIAGSALGFGIVAQRLAHREPVVVLNRPLARGHVLAADDLAVTQVAADAGVALVPAGDSQQLVGRALLTSLPAGALMTPDLLAPGSLAVAGDARMLGLELEPGAYPTASLAAGDRVTVVDAGGAGSVLTDDGVVVSAGPAMEGAATLLVSIMVGVEDAPRVAAAAGQDRVRLLLHGAGR